MLRYNCKGEEMLKTLIILFFISVFGISCNMKLNNTIKDPRQRISQFLNDQTENSDLPGVQYVLVDSNDILMEYVSGYSDIQNCFKMKSNSSMMAYSMTKTFTAVAILQLVESGKVNLDDPVRKYLSDIPYGTEVTVKHLITHTSGIPNPIPLRWIHKANKHLEYDESKGLSKILRESDELSFEPGDKYSYSNIGYWLLGKIIEQTTHMAYSEYMSENVFKKLGLEDGDLSFTISNSANHAKGYLAKYSFFNFIKGFLIDDEIIGEYEQNWLHLKNHYLNGPAFGGLIGSAKCISVFLQDQLKHKSTLITDETKLLLYKQQLDNSCDPIEMSLGWHIGVLNGIEYFFKEGGGGGYHCEMRIYPSLGIGSVIMVNRTNFNSSKFLNTIDEVFISEAY